LRSSPTSSSGRQKWGLITRISAIFKGKVEGKMIGLGVVIALLVGAGAYAVIAIEAYSIEKRLRDVELKLAKIEGQLQERAGK